MIGLSRKPGVSLHHQLFLLLRLEITSGRVRDGELLPSEEVLAARYRVSRATVRRAMRTLEASGMIARFPGVGTRVLAPGAGALTQIGLVGHAETDLVLSLIGFQFISAPPDVSTQFGISPASTILKIVRLRRAGDVPMRLTTHFVPEHLGRHMPPAMLGQKLVLDILMTLGARARRTVDTIGATLADTTDAALLKVEVGDPLLELKRLVTEKGGQPIVLQHSLVSPDRMKLRIESESGDGGGLLDSKDSRAPLRWL